MPIDNGGQIRFMGENLLKTGVSSVTKSSEDPTFPYSNALTDYRARPFKFTGRFQVTTSNNKIYFHDTVDRTATIAVGEYTTRALMATAIQTAMNAVSSGWIVTWNTTNKKFSFTGPSHYLILSNQTNAAWLMMGFTDITNTPVGTLRTPDEFRYHYPYEFVKIDFGYFPEIGFLAIIADSAKPLNISSMANVIIEANTIDDFTSPPVSIALTRSDRGIFKFFDDDSYNYRFWRLRIEDNSAPNEIEIGNLYLGEFTKFKDHYNDQGGVSVDTDRSEVGEAESGQIYSFLKASQRSYENIAIRMIDPDDKDFLKDLFKRFGIANPFYISIDPKMEINNNLDDSTFFCRFEENPRFTHITGNKYNTEFKVRECI